MTLERPFTGMLSVHIINIFWSSLYLTKCTNLICLAKCSLRVKLSLHGGKFSQKKRCPFFFFDALDPSVPAISPSDGSLSSESSMPTSSDPLDANDRFESPRCRDPPFVQGTVG